MPLNVSNVKEKSGSQFMDNCYHVTEKDTATKIKTGGMKSAHLRGETKMTAGSFVDNKNKEEGEFKKRRLSAFLYDVVKQFHTKMNTLANDQALKTALDEIKSFKAGTLTPPSGLGWTATGKFTMLDEDSQVSKIPMRCDDVPYRLLIARGLKSYCDAYGVGRSPPKVAGKFRLPGVADFRKNLDVSRTLDSLIDTSSDHYLVQLVASATEWHYKIEEAILLKHIYFFPPDQFGTIQGYANGKNDPVLLRAPKVLLPGLVQDPSQGGAWMTPDSVQSKDIDVWLPATESWAPISTWAG